MLWNPLPFLNKEHKMSIWTSLHLGSPFLFFFVRWVWWIPFKISVNLAKTWKFKKWFLHFYSFKLWNTTIKYKWPLPLLIKFSSNLMTIQPPPPPPSWLQETDTSLPCTFSWSKCYKGLQKMRNAQILWRTKFTVPSFFTHPHVFMTQFIKFLFTFLTCHTDSNFKLVLYYDPLWFEI